MTDDPPSPRSHRLVVAAAVALHLAHQAWYRHWTIDDAAISYAYARNLVDGWGLVAVPGGERVEGYSNPLWVALLAFWELFGVDGFHSAKWMTAALGAACIPLAWRLARRALPDERGPGALIAPLALGISAHHAIWSASALENALFNFLVLGGLLALLDDAERDRWPRSAAWFLGVALTRPEGLAYAAVAGGWFAWFTAVDRRGLGPVARWLVAFWAPYGAFLTFRLWYFAWPLPNPYYAKLVNQGSFPWDWNARGWSQLRDFAARLWQGWFLPVFVLGLVGWSGRRRWVFAALCLGFALLIGIPGPEAARALWLWPELPDPAWWQAVRIGAITAAAALLPIAGLAHPGGRARALTWSMAACGAGFSVLANGDWMDGLRWMSLFAPATAVLLAVGTAELLRWVGSTVGQPAWGPVGGLIASLVVGLQVAPNASFSRWYRPIVDDYPEMIAPRVRHSEAFAAKVFLDEPLVPLDMDMGAHLMWSAQRPVDMAGLVDVPMSRHTYDQPAFIAEYVFRERKPHVAHVHLRWAEISKLKTYPEWRRDYFPYAGYVDGPNFHDGLFGRKDLVMNDAAVDPADTTGFARGVVLRGLDVPSPEVAPGAALYVDTAWSTSFARPTADPFTVTLFVHREGRVHSWDLPMGYTMSGYPAYPIDRWAPREVFRGQYAVTLPPDLAPGTWDLGFVVRGARGFVLAAGGTAEDPQPVGVGGVVGGRDVDAALARGELRFPARVTVVPPDQALAAAETDRQAAADHANSGRCREAEDTWRLARRHRPHDPAWAGAHEADLGPQLARCWARLATEDADLAPIRLARAHRWSPAEPDLLAIKAPVADRLVAEGLAARERGDWETAYARFRDVLSFAPERAWVRRWAEEARDHRLGLVAARP